MSCGPWMSQGPWALEVTCAPLRDAIAVLIAPLALVVSVSSGIASAALASIRNNLFAAECLYYNSIPRVAIDPHFSFLGVATICPNLLCLVS